MKVFTDTYNVAAGAVIAFMTAAFGVYWYIFAAYLIFNIFDWLTGWYKSRRQKKESSSVGMQGIIKKLGYWVIIAVAFLVSDIFVQLGKDILHINLSFLMMVGWFTLACLMVNEARSILENLVECGYDVPDILIQGLEIADKMIKQESENDNEKD